MYYTETLIRAMSACNFLSTISLKKQQQDTVSSPEEGFPLLSDTGSDYTV